MRFKTVSFFFFSLALIMFFTQPISADGGSRNTDSDCSGCSCGGPSYSRPADPVEYEVVGMREGHLVASAVDTIPEVTMRETILCNDMELENGIAFESDETYKLCGPITESDSVVEALTNKVLKTTIIKQGEHVKLHVEKTNGATIEATLRCNKWKPDTNPIVYPGDKIKICGPG